MINNRITTLFEQKKSEILNIYFTAGYPGLEDTPTIIKALDEAGTDIIEIGIPFSDPIADGPTIQASNQQALDNGMTLRILFDQLMQIRDEVSIPIILMGYLNPIIQMGIEKFCSRSKEVGVDGFILPDLPMFEYENRYKEMFDSHNLSNIFLISPQTSEDRIKRIDELTEGFIYMVSMDSTTGRTGKISTAQKAYFERIQGLKLQNPLLIGFGIHSRETFETASQFANGAIIGSAFINHLKGKEDVSSAAKEFVAKIRG